MDTAAYLTRQGWRGSGHSLHPSGHGIAKPLLVSKKNDVLGVGNRKNDALASQWWLKAFDTTLKQINSGVADKTSKSVEKATSKFQRSFYSNALYSNFVKGEGLGGTHAPVAEPQARIESIGQFDEAMDNGTALESKGKGRAKRRNADHAAVGSILVPTIASSGNGTLEDEMTRGSQRKLIKNRKAGQVTAPESIGEKCTTYLETRPLENGVEENPRLKRTTEVEPGETRYSKFSEEKNSATYETGALDSHPPRKRRRGRTGFNEVGSVKAPETGREKALAKTDSSDHEALKDSWSNPKAEEKSGKIEVDERQPIENSDDEMNILSKLEEQLSYETTMGQVEQVESANGQDLRKQLGKHEQQLTKQEMAEIRKSRKKRRNSRRVRRSLKKDLERISQPKSASLSQAAEDLSEYQRSTSGESNRVRKPHRKSRILRDNAVQPTSSLPPIPRGPRRKNRIPGDNAGQPTLSLPPMANHLSKENMSASLGKSRVRRLQRKNRILRADVGQPTSYLPPTANHVSEEEKSTVLKKRSKLPPLRLSSKHVDRNARASKPSSRAAEFVPGEGKPASRKQKKASRRNETLLEYDDEPVATTMDAITQFLKSRAASQSHQGP